jgi:hypothetical protein
MAKEIVEQDEAENLPANNPQHNAYEAYGAQATQRTIVGSILKFAKGRWLYGMDNEEMPDDVKLIVDMRTLTIGWQKWEDNKPVDNHMGLVSERYQAPARKTIGDQDESLWEEDENGKAKDPWQKSNMVLMREVGTEGPDEGLYTFITSSRGGLNAVGEISKRYGRMMREDDQVMPVVELDAGSYAHSNKRLGIIDIPVFKIAGWANVADVDDATETVVGGADEVVDGETGEVTEKPKAAPRAAAAASKPASKRAEPPKKPEPAKKPAAGKKKTRF